MNKRGIEKVSFVINGLIIKEFVPTMDILVEFNVSLQEMKTVFGILLVSGYHPQPNRKMCWSVKEDFCEALVAKALHVIDLTK